MIPLDSGRPFEKKNKKNYKTYKYLQILIGINELKLKILMNFFITQIKS